PSGCRRPPGRSEPDSRRPRRARDPWLWQACPPDPPPGWGRRPAPDSALLRQRPRRSPRACRPRRGSGRRRSPPAPPAGRGPNSRGPLLVGTTADQLVAAAPLVSGIGLFDRTDGRVGDQIRAEVAVERRQRFRFGGREPEADVAVGADQDHAACRQAGAGGIDVRVVTDPHEFGPASSQPRERREALPGRMWTGTGKAARRAVGVAGGLRDALPEPLRAALQSWVCGSRGDPPLGVLEPPPAAVLVSAGSGGVPVVVGEGAGAERTAGRAG